MAATAKESEAMEEDPVEDDYVDQEEPEEWEMETEELGDEVAPQDQTGSMEAMTDMVVDAEMPTSTTRTSFTLGTSRASGCYGSHGSRPTTGQHGRSS